MSRTATRSAEEAASGEVRSSVTEHAVETKSLPFDNPAARSLVQARIAFLDRLLTSWPGPQISTALDAGAGVGYLAGHLAIRHKLRVTALDVRNSNVDEARRRHREPQFVVGDVEDASTLSLGDFDLVLAFGLIYHLENPAQAVRHLAQMTGHLLVVESMIAPGKLPQAQMLDEFPGADQGLRHFAFHPTESGLVKLLYRAGMQRVYRPTRSVDDPDFRGTPLRRRMRTLLVATRNPIEVPTLRAVHEPSYKLDRAYSFRSPLRSIVRYFLQRRRNRRKDSNVRTLN
jgi:SAM-dependent methyltransferase